jgi:hypothetical protein
MLVHACTVVVLAIAVLLAVLGAVEGATELVHAYGGTGVDEAYSVVQHSIDAGE